MNNENDDRGMMKWTAYKSLIEQESSLSRMAKKKNEVPKPLLSNEEAEEINDIIVNYHGETVSLSIWKKGVITSIEGTLSKIDPTFKTLKINEKSISFSSIVSLKTI